VHKQRGRVQGTFVTAPGGMNRSCSGDFVLETFSKSFVARYFAIGALPIAFSAFTKPRHEFFETVIEFHIGDLICASPALAVQPI